MLSDINAPRSPRWWQPKPVRNKSIVLAAFLLGCTSQLTTQTVKRDAVATSTQTVTTTQATTNANGSESGGLTITGVVREGTRLTITWTDLASHSYTLVLAADSLCSKPLALFSGLSARSQTVQLPSAEPVFICLFRDGSSRAVGAANNGLPAPDTLASAPPPPAPAPPLLIPSPTPRAAPTAFAIASAVPGDARVTLTWGAASNSASFTVKRATASGGPYSAVLRTNATSPFVDDTAVNGITYFYQVTAVGVGGSTSAVSEVSATPAAPPAAPDGLIAAAGNAGVTLSWNAVSNAASYSVYVATTTGVTPSNGTKIAVGNTTSYDHVGLANGTTYYYVVTAVAAAGNEGAPSPEAFATAATGSLYIADALNGRVRMVNGSNFDVSTVAGGASQYGAAPTQVGLGPSASAVDGFGNVFIADQTNGVVRVVAAITGVILGVPVTAGKIYTVAGNGALGYSGDGGVATSATLNAVTGVAVDSSGNLYVADYWNSRVRAVAAATGTFFGVPVSAGHIYTVAGNGTSGYGGDNGLSTSAALSAPTGVAVDSSGNIYIADQGNSRIRVVAATTGTLFGVSVTTGKIYTVVGTGALGSSGDTGLALAAKLFTPVAVAVDGSGNLFIADSGVGRVRVVASVTGNVLGVAVTAGHIYTVAGSGAYGNSGDTGPAAAAVVSSITGVAVDSAGNLYLADSQNYAIRAVAAATGTILDVAVTAGNIYRVAGNGSSGYSGDTGAATAASLRLTYGVAVDAQGNLYIADTPNQRLRVVAAATGTFFGVAVTLGSINTLAGNGTFAFSGDAGVATSAGLASASGLAGDRQGNIYVADTFDHRVRVVAASTGLILGVPATAGHIVTVAGTGTGPCAYSGDGGAAISANLCFPASVALDSAGNLYIADKMNQRVRLVAAVTGSVLGVAVTAGNIYTVAGSGTSGYSGDTGVATLAKLQSPEGVTLDSSGNLYIADSINNRIRVVAAATGSFLGVVVTAGHIYTVAGNGTLGTSGDGGVATAASLSRPVGVTVSTAGDLYIADTGSSRIRVVAAATGTFFGVAVTGAHIDTIAGNGVPGFSGDGGAAIAAKLSSPSSVAVDASGNLLIADRGNNRVRVVAALAGTVLGTAVTPSDIFTVVGNGAGAFGGDGGSAIAAGLNYPAGVAFLPP